MVPCTQSRSSVIREYPPQGEAAGHQEEKSDDPEGAWQQRTGNAEAPDALLETSHRSNKDLLLHNPELQMKSQLGGSRPGQVLQQAKYYWSQV